MDNLSQGNGSEVARLLATIDAEYEAANNALYSPALGMARHAFISARMERMGDCFEELQTMMPAEQAIKLIATHLEHTESAKQPGQTPD